MSEHPEAAAYTYQEQQCERQECQAEFAKSVRIEPIKYKHHMWPDHYANEHNEKFRTGKPVASRNFNFIQGFLEFLS